MYACFVQWQTKTCQKYLSALFSVDGQQRSSPQLKSTSQGVNVLFSSSTLPFSVFLIISHQHMECGYADVHGIMYLKVNGEMTSSTKQSLLVHISLALTPRPLRVPGSFYVVCWACTLYFFWKGLDVSHRPALLRLCSCMETCVNKASVFLSLCRCDPTLSVLFCTVAPSRIYLLCNSTLLLWPCPFSFSYNHNVFFISLCLSLHSCLRQVSL